MWGALWGTIVIVVLPELLKRVNDDITNLVFGVLLVGIMIFWRRGDLRSVEADSECGSPPGATRRPDRRSRGSSGPPCRF